MDAGTWLNTVTPITQYPGWRLWLGLAMLALLGALCLVGFLLADAQYRK